MSFPPKLTELLLNFLNNIPSDHHHIVPTNQESFEIGLSLSYYAYTILHDLQ